MWTPGSNEQQFVETVDPVRYGLPAPVLGMDTPEPCAAQALAPLAGASSPSSSSCVIPLDVPGECLKANRAGEAFDVDAQSRHHLPAELDAENASYRKLFPLSPAPGVAGATKSFWEDSDDEPEPTHDCALLCVDCIAKAEKMSAIIQETMWRINYERNRPAPPSACGYFSVKSRACLPYGEKEISGQWRPHYHVAAIWALGRMSENDYLPDDALRNVATYLMGRATKVDYRIKRWPKEDIASLCVLTIEEQPVPGATAWRRHDTITFSWKGDTRLIADLGMKTGVCQGATLYQSDVFVRLPMSVYSYAVALYTQEQLDGKYRRRGGSDRLKHLAVPSLETELKILHYIESRFVEQPSTSRLRLDLRESVMRSWLTCRMFVAAMTAHYDTDYAGRTLENRSDPIAIHPGLDFYDPDVSGQCVHNCIAWMFGLDVDPDAGRRTTTREVIILQAQLRNQGYTFGVFHSAPEAQAYCRETDQPALWLDDQQGHAKAFKPIAYGMRGSKGKGKERTLHREARAAAATEDAGGADGPSPCPAAAGLCPSKATIVATHHDFGKLDVEKQDFLTRGEKWVNRVNTSERDIKLAGEKTKLKDAAEVEEEAWRVQNVAWNDPENFFRYTNPGTLFSATHNKKRLEHQHERALVMGKMMDQVKSIARWDGVDFPLTADGLPAAAIGPALGADLLKTHEMAKLKLHEAVALSNLKREETLALADANHAIKLAEATRNSDLKRAEAIAIATANHGFKIIEANASSTLKRQEALAIADASSGIRVAEADNMVAVKFKEAVEIAKATAEQAPDGTVRRGPVLVAKLAAEDAVSRISDASKRRQKDAEVDAKLREARESATIEAAQWDVNGPRRLIEERKRAIVDAADRQAKLELQRAADEQKRADVRLLLEERAREKYDAKINYSNHKGEIFSAQYLNAYRGSLELLYLHEDGAERIDEILIYQKTQRGTSAFRMRPQVLVATMLPKMPSCPNCAETPTKWCFCPGPLNSMHVRVPSNMSNVLPCLARAYVDPDGLAATLGCTSVCSCPVIIRGGKLVGVSDYCDLCRSMEDPDVTVGYCGMEIDPKFLARTQGFYFSPSLSNPSYDTQIVQHDVAEVLQGKRSAEEAAEWSIWFRSIECNQTLLGEVKLLPVNAWLARTACTVNDDGTPVRCSISTMRSTAHWCFTTVTPCNGVADAPQQSVSLTAHAIRSSLRNVYTGQSAASFRVYTLFGISLAFRMDNESRSAHYIPVHPMLTLKLIQHCSTMGWQSVKDDDGKFRQLANDLYIMGLREAKALYYREELSADDYTHMMLPDIVRTATHTAIMRTAASMNELQDSLHPANMSGPDNAVLRQFRGIDGPKKPILSVSHKSNHGQEVRILKPPGLIESKTVAVSDAITARVEAVKQSLHVEMFQTQGWAGKVSLVPAHLAGEAPHTCYEDRCDYVDEPRLEHRQLDSKGGDKGRPSSRICDEPACQRIALGKYTYRKGLCPDCARRTYNVFGYDRGMAATAYGKYLQLSLDSGACPALPRGVEYLTYPLFSPALEAVPKHKPIREKMKHNLDEMDNSPVDSLGATRANMAGVHNKQPDGFCPNYLAARVAKMNGPAFKRMPSVFASSQRNLRIAARYRLGAKPKGYNGTGKEKPGFYEELITALNTNQALLDVLCPGLRKHKGVERLSNMEWIQGYPKSRQEPFFQELLKPDYGQKSVYEVSRFEAFMKFELASNNLPPFDENPVAESKVEHGVQEYLGEPTSRGTGPYRGKTYSELPAANPRMICVPTLESHLLIGPYTRPMTSELKKMWNKDHFLFYASAKPEDLDSWVNQFYPNRGQVVASEADGFETLAGNEGKTHKKQFAKRDELFEPEVVRSSPHLTSNIMAVINDFSMMEQSFTLGAWKLVRFFLARWGFPNSGRAADVWQAWCTPNVTVRDRKHRETPIRIQPGNGNASGRDDTAMANAIINGVLTALGWMLAYLKLDKPDATLADVYAISREQLEIFREHVRIAVVGDDQYTIVPKAWERVADTPAAVCAMGGFECKMQSFQDYTHAVFLARRPVPCLVLRPAGWTKELRWGSQLGRMMYKAFWRREGGRGGTGWAKGRAFSEYLINGHVPMVRALFRRTLELTSGANMKLPSDFRLKPIRERRTMHRPSDQTWEWLHTCYGISRELALDLESLFMNMHHILCTVSHPAIDLIFDVDGFDC